MNAETTIPTVNHIPARIHKVHIAAGIVAVSFEVFEAIYYWWRGE